MKVLLDSDVVLTYITGREDIYQNEAPRIMERCASGDIDGFIAFHSVSVLWYILKKIKGAGETRQWLKNLCEVLTVSGASHDQVVSAIDKTEFSDFEDCLVDQCARAAGVDYIITGNIRDYSVSEVPAITPKKFLEEVK